MLDKFPSMKFVTLTSLKGGWLKSLEGKRVQGVAPFGKPGESGPEPPREHTAGWGEGRRGKWQAGIGKAAGELKYADGEMCECLEKGKTRITGNEGAGGADSGIYHAWD